VQLLAAHDGKLERAGVWGWSARETALLETLSAPATRHAFCVVEGEPGSGKSHLIRWLRVKWPYEEDLVLLIQRADGSLEGTLCQLQEKLPAEYQHLFEYVGRPQEITLAGRSRVFQGNRSTSAAPASTPTTGRGSPTIFGSATRTTCTSTRWDCSRCGDLFREIQ